MKRDNQSMQKQTSSSYSTAKAWDERYSSQKGLGVPGTFTHSDRGNKQFYRVKFNALDRTMARVGDTWAGKRVLDLAGGSGQFIDYYLSRGAAHVTVADFTQVALDSVNNRYLENERVSTLLFDMRNQDVVWQEQYDVVLIMEAIFLLPTDSDAKQAISNASSALNPGGYLIISDVFPAEAIQENQYVVRRSRLFFEETLLEHGLTTLAYVPQTYMFNRHMFSRKLQLFLERADPFLYWLDRLALKLGLRPEAGSPADVKYSIARKINPQAPEA
jgi:2-polyprenyl-3-methyl-5-hydroxy-6-metoxy-1,4-benzoquinol methylase